MEVMRLDLPDDTEKADLYFWFLIREDADKAKKLTFLEMDSEEGVELRAFEEGELQFDSSMAELLLDNDYDLPLIASP